jgi:hypothetical protein
MIMSWFARQWLTNIDEDGRLLLEDNVEVPASTKGPHGTLDTMSAARDDLDLDRAIWAHWESAGNVLGIELLI